MVKEISREQFRKHLENVAKRSNSVLNPDQEDLDILIDGLLENRQRYGYPACPCRLSCGKIEHDKDVVCPCDYQPADLEEFGACYCALYVTKDWAEGKIEQKQVPERRPIEKQDVFDKMEE